MVAPSAGLRRENAVLIRQEVDLVDSVRELLALAGEATESARQTETLGRRCRPG